MADVIGNRLKELLKLKRMSQAEVANAIGVTQPTIGRLIDGTTKETGKLLELAIHLETTPEYLVGWSDEIGPEARLNDRQQPFKGAAFKTKPDTVDLQEFDLAYGLGASFIHDVPVTGEARTFSRGWLRHFTESPFDKLFWARGIGDSMTPTIQDADVVLIDTAQRTPRIWDKLWAVEMGGMGMIKRLRPTKDANGMRLLSDAGQPEETAYDGEMNVIGRVVAIVRKV